MQNQANQPNPAATTKALPEGWTSATVEMSPAQMEALKKNLQASRKQYAQLQAAGAPRRALTPEELKARSQGRQLTGFPDGPYDPLSDTVIDTTALSKKMRRALGKLALFAVLLCALGVMGLVALFG